MKLKLKVTPNSNKNQVVGWLGQFLKVKIKAPADRGRANDELINFLAQELNIQRSQINLEKGLTSRRKLISIKGLKRDDINDLVSNTK